MTCFILACSGPGALQAIQDNILYAREHSILVGGIAVLSITFWFLTRRWTALPLYILCMLLVHPAWTVSAISGDCGFFKAAAATFVTLVAGASAGLVLSALARARSSARPGAAGILTNSPDELAEATPRQWYGKGAATAATLLDHGGSSARKGWRSRCHQT